MNVIIHEPDAHFTTQELAKNVGMQEEISTIHGSNPISEKEANMAAIQVMAKEGYAIGQEAFGV